MALSAARKSASASGAGFFMASTFPEAFPETTSYCSKSFRVRPTNCLPNFAIAQFSGVLAGHFLDVEALDASFEVEDHENLDAAELAFLVDPVDVTDLLLVGEYFIDRVGHVDGLIDAVEFVPEPGFHRGQEFFSALLQDRGVDRLVPGGFRKEPGHVAVRVIQVATHGAPGSRASSQEEERRHIT